MMGKLIPMRRPRRFSTVTTFLLAAVLFQACALSHEPPGKSPPDPSTNPVTPGNDSTVETDPGSDNTPNEGVPNGAAGSGPGYAGTGRATAGNTGSSDSSTERNPIGEAEPTVPQTTNEWKESYPQAGIDAENVEQLPLGIWIGETGEEVACSPSHRVAIEIAAGADPGTAYGFAVFGEGDPPPPVSDPEVGYPPGEGREELWCRMNAPSEGFAYTIREGHVGSNDRFRFRIANLEIYEPWCALQTSYQWNYGSIDGYNCAPALDSDEWMACGELGGGSFYPPPADDAECPLDYGKFALCDEFGPCICTEEGCIANMNRTVRFDLMINGTEIEGVVTNLSLGDTPPTEVRLRKVR
jgi:hypothetical protein